METIKHTRADYMDNRCSHQDYYAQFLTPQFVGVVERYIGRGRILTSKDEHFNDIPLHEWDWFYTVIYPSVWEQLRAAGDVNPKSLGNAVCIAKAAARQIQDNARIEGDI